MFTKLQQRNEGKATHYNRLKMCITLRLLGAMCMGVVTVRLEVQS